MLLEILKLNVIQLGLVTYITKIGFIKKKLKVPVNISTSTIYVCKLQKYNPHSEILYYKI